jgi:hypothetical protein
MSDGRVAGFFYGLFMDVELLRTSGVSVSEARRAYVDDFALRIGRRATLVPSPGARAYGMVIALTHADLDRLYGAPGLEDYRAEAVLARLLDGGLQAALCYNLGKPPAPDERNAEYARRLSQLLARLDFPPEYIASLA